MTTLRNNSERQNLDMVYLMTALILGLQLNGVPIGGPVTLGPGGVFTTTFPAPTTPGTYTLLTTYTPTGMLLILDNDNIHASNLEVISSHHPCNIMCLGARLSHIL